MSAHRAAHRGVSPFVLLTIAPFFWSCNAIVGRALSTDVPPFAMTFYRWLFALAVLAPFALPRVVRNWRVLRDKWKVMLLLGAIGIGSHNALTYFGLNYTTATNAVILNSFIPIMIVALSWIFLRERLSALQVAGVAVSLVGVLTILSRGSFGALAAFRLNTGDLFVIGSIAMWSVYTICLRWRPQALDTIAFLFVIACVGELVILPFYLGEIAFGRQAVWTWRALLALFGVGVFSSVIAYIFWNRGVTQVGASVAGLFVHLMPVFGVVLAWLILDERLAAFHIVGIVLILTGITVTSRKPRAEIVVAQE